jgi:hypothetical protein
MINSYFTERYIYKPMVELLYLNVFVFESNAKCFPRVSPEVATTLL